MDGLKQVMILIDKEPFCSHHHCSTWQQILRFLSIQSLHDEDEPVGDSVELQCLEPGIDFILDVGLIRLNVLEGEIKL